MRSRFAGEVLELFIMQRDGPLVRSYHMLSRGKRFPHMGKSGFTVFDINPSKFADYICVRFSDGLDHVSFLKSPTVLDLIDNILSGILDVPKFCINNFRDRYIIFETKCFLSFLK